MGKSLNFRLSPLILVSDFKKGLIVIKSYLFAGESYRPRSEELQDQKKKSPFFISTK